MMRTNPGDVMRTTLTCRRPAIGDHAGSGGMRQERSVSGLLSSGWGYGVWGQHRCREFLQDRVGLSFVRGRELPKKK
jgi:hypothetical protein